MDNFLKWICMFLNIEATNEFLVEDIIFELSKLKSKDFINFKEFIKANVNNYDLKYKNNLQKFYELKKMYLLEKNKHIFEGLEKKAHDLATKITDAFDYETQEIILRNNFDFKNVMLGDKPCFDKKELYIIGKRDKQRIYQLIRFGRSYLKDELLQIYKKEANKIIGVNEIEYKHNETETHQIELKAPSAIHNHTKDLKTLGLANMFQKF